MAMNDMTVSISERAKARSLIAARGLTSIMLFLITFAMAALIARLRRDGLEMDAHGKLIVALLIVLVLVLWLAWVAAILRATSLRKKRFALISGAVSIRGNSLEVGGLYIARSSIDSVGRSWRHLVVRYRINGKVCQAAIPLRWLPRDAARRIIQELQEDQTRKGEDQKRGETKKGEKPG
jgi:hypothetical protein